MAGNLLYSIGHSIIYLSDHAIGRVSFAAIVGSIGGFLVVAGDSIFEDFGVHPHLLHVASAITIGIFLGLLTYVEISAVRERRRRVVENLRTVSELNHVLRNSLQAIQYAAHLSADDKHIQIINDCIYRIDSALHELFPVVIDPRRAKR